MTMPPSHLIARRCQRRKAFLLSLAASTALAGCWRTGSAQAAAGAQGHPDSIPFVIVALADSLAKQDLWPGFDPRATPVAIFDGTRTLLFRHPAPPQPFTPLQGHAGVWMHDGRDSSVSANTSTEMNGVRTATLMPATGRATTLDRAAILIHEMFHVFQRQHHPGWTANEADLFTYPTNDRRLLELRRLETGALRRAANRGGSEKAACWAQAAVKLRRERFAAMPASAAAYERGTELNEGLATYVERRAIDAPDSTIFPDSAIAPEAVRQRAYRTGAALARLLDRLSPRWRAELEAHDSLSLDSMLTVVLAARHQSPCAFSDAERNRMLQAAWADQQSLARRLAVDRRTFFDQPGWRLVIEAASPLFPQGFDPLNVRLLAPGEVLHSRFVKLGNSAGSVEVMGRAALSVAAGTHPLFSGVRTLLVTGLPGPPQVTVGDSGLTVSADGIHGTFQATSVDTAGMVVTLHLP